MDMAVANLFKHNARFRISGKAHDTEEPHLYSKGRQYISRDIENARSIGVNNSNELRLKCVQPFLVHAISTIVKEEREHIDHTYFMTEVSSLPDDDRFIDTEHPLIRITLDNPKYCIHLLSSNSETTIYTFPEHVLDGPFFIWVNVFYYFIPPRMREFYISEWLQFMRARRLGFIDKEEEEGEEEYRCTPPDETYRQDRCIICLDSNPNILYLECKHIAVCDSCDRMKRTERLRKYCDICRAEISRRIKI